MDGKLEKYVKNIYLSSFITGKIIKIMYQQDWKTVQSKAASDALGSSKGLFWKALLKGSSKGLFQIPLQKGSSKLLFKNFTPKGSP